MIEMLGFRAELNNAGKSYCIEMVIPVAIAVVATSWLAGCNSGESESDVSA
jgi:hypothetical protein